MIRHYGLTDYDLVGFSLGSRTSARAVIAGARPRRLVLGGMGLEGLAGWLRRQAFFGEVLDNWMAKHTPGEKRAFRIAAHWLEKTRRNSQERLSKQQGVLSATAPSGP